MEDRFVIVCGLCTCHFSSVELDDDALLCEACGHSLHDDHAALRREAPSARRQQQAALSYLK
jgi:hypothetical protein